MPNGSRPFLEDLGHQHPVDDAAVGVDEDRRELAEAALETGFAARGKGVDANNAIYQLDSSRNYNPEPGLEKITVPVLWINSADDFINPPGLGMAEMAVKRMPRARFILIPENTETKGHSTHTWAKFWKADLARLMAE